MKLSVECRILGGSPLPEPIQIQDRDGTTYLFEGPAEALETLTITKKLPADTKAFAGLNADNTQLAGDWDEQTYKDIMEQFKDWESMMGFGLEIQRVEWQSPTVSLIPETEEEAASIQVSRIQVRRGKPVKTSIATAKELGLMSKHRELLRPLRVLKAFWREGQNEMEACRFIQAFMNFFLVIEGLYANGQFGKKEVLREFSASQELNDAVEGFLKSRHYPGSDKHDLALQEMVAHRKKQYDVPGLLYVLVDTRGELAHYLQKSRRKYGDPFRHEEYEAIVLLGLFITTHGIAREIRKLAPPAPSIPTPENRPLRPSSRPPHR